MNCRPYSARGRFPASFFNLHYYPLSIPEVPAAVIPADILDVDQTMDTHFRVVHLVRPTAQADTSSHFPTKAVAACNVGRMGKMARAGRAGKAEQDGSPQASAVPATC